MAKKIKLEMTVPQYEAMCNMVDTISSMIGEGSDFTIVNNKNLILFDRMLNSNGRNRNFT